MLRIVVIGLLALGFVQQYRPVATYGQGQIESAVWLEDGHTLAAAGAHGLWLYDMARPDVAPKLIESRRGWIRTVAIGGSVLATGHHDGSIMLWDTGDFHEIGGIVEAVAGPVTKLAISQDGSRLVAVSKRGAAQVWETRSQKPLLTIIIPEIEGVFALAISGDGRQIAIASGYLSADAMGDGVIQVWDVDQKRPLPAPDEGFFLPNLDFSPDGRWLVVSSAGGPTRFWDMENDGYAYPPGVVPDGMTSVFGPDGEKLFSYNGFDLTVLKVGSWELIEKLESQEPGIIASDLQIGARYAALIGSDQHNTKGLWAWTLSSGEVTPLAISRPLTGVFLQEDRPVARYSMPDQFGRAKFVWLDDNSTLDTASTSVLSHDGHWLTWLDDEGLHVHNLVNDDTQVFEAAFDGNGKPLLAFSPDSHLLAATTTESEAISIWDVTKGKSIQTVEATLPHDLAWNETHLVASSAWGVWLWAVDSWEKTTIRLNEGYLSASGVALDQEHVVVWDRPMPGMDDYTGFALYTVSLNDTVLRPLVASTMAFTGLDATLCPDGTCVAVAASDGRIRLIDLISGQTTDTLETRQGKVTAVLFDSVGRLVMGTESGLVQVWETP